MPVTLRVRSDGSKVEGGRAGEVLQSQALFKSHITGLGSEDYGCL